MRRRQTPLAFDGVCWDRGWGPRGLSGQVGAGGMVAAAGSGADAVFWRLCFSTVLGV